MPRLVLVLMVILSVACSSAVPKAPTMSPHFEPVAKHLHLGGTVFAYVDIDGDTVRAARFVMELLDAVPEAKSFLNKITPEELVEILGLHNLKSFGFSSYQDGALFHNRMFIHHQGPRTGLMRIPGDDPRPHPVLRYAPDDSDLVFGREINLHVVLKVVQALSARGIGLEPAMLNAMLKAPAFGLSLTMEELFKRLHTDVSMVASVNPNRPLDIPDTQASVPFTQFVIRVEGLGVLVDGLAKNLGPMPDTRVTETDEMLSIGPAKPLPAPWNAYRPAFAHDKTDGSLLIVSSLDYLKHVRAGATSVENTANYKMAMKKLPRTGNAVAYMSPQLISALHKFVDQLPRITNDDEMEAAGKIARFLLPDEGNAIAWTSTNLPDGILSAGNTTSSHKVTFLTGGGILIPALIGIGAAVAIPAFANYGKESKTSEAKTNLQNLGSAFADRCTAGKKMPAATPPIPAQPRKDQQIGDFGFGPGFRELGFNPGLIYYSYSIRRPNDATVVFVAEGDLDGDGKFSYFALECDKSCECAPFVYEQDPLE